MRCVSIAPDGVLIVPENIPFQPARDRIVVPRGVLNGLLTAIHLRFDHPTQHQMKRLVTRFFFSLDMDSAIDVTVSACHHCTALKALPCSIEPQSTSPPPNVMGQTFAADVMRRYRQCVLVLRDTVSCHTKSIIIADEKRDTLRTALLTLCSELRCLGDAGITIRVDGAPGFTSLSNDTIFQKHGIKLEIGNVKNLNKNPVAEKAIQELGLELLHLIPEGGPISELNLALSTANMNARIRQHGLSARELWTQRDQLTGEQLPVDDRQVIIQQYQSRIINHPHSAHSKAPKRISSSSSDLEIGYLVYLRSERDKTKPRCKYMICSIADKHCYLRKFTKSQFRSKSYKVPLSECYPIQGTTLSQTPQAPYVGLTSLKTKKVNLILSSSITLQMNQIFHLEHLHLYHQPLDRVLIQLTLYTHHLN